MRSALYNGTLIHARRGEVENVFRYGVSYFLVDLDELPELDRRLKLLSVNRPNVVSLYDRDHFEGTPLRQAVLDIVDDPTVERVLMLAQLRVLGYVFNPVTFYWCYRANGELACMVAELNNTFGERLPELLRGGSLRYEHDKRLHVSPFFGLDQRYRYAFSEPGDQLYARVEVHENGRRALQAVLHARRQELTNTTLARALVRYPLMPAKVIGLIHWQALRLWLKGAPFHHKPPFVPGEGSLPQ